MKAKTSDFWSLIVNYLIIAFWYLHVFSCLHLIIKHFVSSKVLCYSISFVFALIIYILCLKNWQGKSIFSLFQSFRNWINPKVLKWSDSPFRIIVIVFLLPLLLRFFLVLMLHIPIKGDPGVYIDISKEIATNGIVIRNAEYSSNFPHIFWFGMFLVPASLFSYLGDWVFQIYISFILSCNALLIYKICVNICGNRLSAVKIAVIYSYMPSQLFCGLTVTHEISFTFFFLLALLIWCKYKTMCAWCVVCFLLAIARLINSVGIIALLALFCCILFERTFFKKIKIKVLTILLLVLITVVVSLCANAIQTKMTKGDVVLNRSSIEWQLFIGGNTNTGGVWNKQDVEIFSQIDENYDNIAEAKIAYRDLAINRWINILNSPINLFKHFLVKFCIDWCGPYYSIGLTNIFLSSKNAFLIMTALVLINHFLYMLLIVLALPRMIRRKNEVEHYAINYMKTSILGTVCMLLFTEAMNKYTLSMLGPIVLVSGYYLFNNNIKSFEVQTYAQ